MNRKRGEEEMEIGTLREEVFICSEMMIEHCPRKACQSSFSMVKPFRRIAQNHKYLVVDLCYKYEILSKNLALRGDEKRRGTGGTAVCS